MTETKFSTMLTAKGPTYLYPSLARNAVTTLAEVFKLAPIPPYMVYDGFDQDLDAALVLECIMSTTNTSTSVTHIKNFLRACLSLHNSSDNKPYLLGTELSAAPSMVSKKWAKTKFSLCFPTLLAATPIVRPGTTATTTVNNLPQGQALLDLIAVIKSTNNPTKVN